MIFHFLPVVKWVLYHFAGKLDETYNSTKNLILKAVIITSAEIAAIINIFYKTGSIITPL